MIKVSSSDSQFGGFKRREKRRKYLAQFQYEDDVKPKEVDFSIFSPTQLLPLKGQKRRTQPKRLFYSGDTKSIDIRNKDENTEKRPVSCLTFIRYGDERPSTFMKPSPKVPPLPVRYRINQERVTVPHDMSKHDSRNNVFDASWTYIGCSPIGLGSYSQTGHSKQSWGSYRETKPETIIYRPFETSQTIEKNL